MCFNLRLLFIKIKYSLPFFTNNIQVGDYVEYIVFVPGRDGWHWKGDRDSGTVTDVGWVGTGSRRVKIVRILTDDGSIHIPNVDLCRKVERITT